MAEESNYIQFSAIQKSFGSNQIYKDLTLSVNKGETLVILGSSGTGKSVMLKMLVGLLKPDEGEIYFNGEEISEKGEKDLLPIRKKIAMVFQGGALFDSLSVGENVAFPLREHFDLPEREIARRVAEKLELVGLPGIENRKPSDLSGGMKKRVALARAIVAGPEVVLYDEPTTGLDPMNTRRISQLIMSVQKDLHVTSLVVTHDIASAFMVADRMVMLHEKKVLAVLSKEEFRHTKEPVIREFIDAMEGTNMLESSQPKEKLK